MQLTPMLAGAAFILGGVMNLPSSGGSQSAHDRSGAMAIRPEHIAFNVPDPPAMVRWYCAHLGMKAVREGSAPTYGSFIADSGGHIMLELYHQAECPVLEYRALDPASLHLAFAVDSMEGTRDALLASGATPVEAISTTPSGDRVTMLRDPWGIPLQLVQRVSPMLSGGGVRPEHLAMNVDDARAVAGWYISNLGMQTVRESGAPSFGRFIGDAERRMLKELYQNPTAPMISCDSVEVMSLHLAYAVEDVAGTRDRLVAAGARIARDLSGSAGGDTVLMMRDPWGVPIQFVHRGKPLL